MKTFHSRDHGFGLVSTPLTTGPPGNRASTSPRNKLGREGTSLTYREITARRQDSQKRGDLPAEPREHALALRQHVLVEPARAVGRQPDQLASRGGQDEAAALPTEAVRPAQSGVEGEGQKHETRRRRGKSPVPGTNLN